MNVRNTLFRLLLAHVFASITGCGKSEPDQLSMPPASLVPSPDSVARIHWLGKKRLGIEASAYYFMRIWQLAPSAQLEMQTLDKLSTAPWRLLARDAQASVLNLQPSASPLRPLLNDLVYEESYVEIRHPTNHPAEMVLAIRLSDEQAGRWETNLAIALQSLTGGSAIPASAGRRGWSLRKGDAPNLIELIRIGDWTVIGAAQDKNPLLAETVARVRSYHHPFSRPGTNYWLEADVDLRRTAGALSLNWNLPENSPEISIAVTGDGGNVLTYGELTFQEPLRMELEPWTAPTDLIHEPLTGFTAVRGIRPWLTSWERLSDIQLGVAPDQVYLWSQDGGTHQSYFAAPLPDAVNQVRQLTEHLMGKGNAWLDSHGYISFVRSPDANGVTWGSLPDIKPFLKSATGSKGGFIFGGLAPSPESKSQPPMRAELLDALAGRTNLVCYDWENTAMRIEPCLNIGQIIRTLLRRDQLPLESASATWLGTIRFRLGESTTVVTSTRANQLSFVRKSTVGFTAAELHLLAQWLESSTFPQGL